MLWYADSGANVHICRNKHLISDFRLHYTSILVAGKARSTVLGRGTVHLRCPLEDGSSGATLSLPVYYLPDSPANLLSLSVLAAQKIYWNNKDFQLRQDQDILAYTPLQNNGLYAMQLMPDQMTALSAASITPLSVWHRRLGHLAYGSLRTYLNRLNYEFVDDCTDNHCEACKLVKARKKPNRGGTTKHPEAPFETIHTDLVPITVEGFQKERYYVTITDGYTRWMEVYTVKRKSEWLRCLEEYASWVSTHFGRAIKIIRTDYGSELRGKEADAWFLEHGIQFEPAPVDAQDVNGVAEAHQRTLTIMIKTALLAAGIPDFLWPDVALAMVYIKNRRPTSYLNGLSPFESLHRGAPKMSNLYPLGVTVYVVKDSKYKDHLTPNADKGILIGYDGDTIYRVWIPEAKEIRRVKDLDFYDHPANPKTSTDFGEGEFLVTEPAEAAEAQPEDAEAPIVVSEQGGNDVQRPTAPTSYTTPSITPSITTETQSKKARRRAQSHRQGGPQPIPKEHVTMRSGRKTSRPVMDPKTYATIHSASPAVFNAAMTDLLANWDFDEEDLISLMSVVTQQPPESTSSLPALPDPYVDAVNPLALFAGYIESVGAANLEDFIAMISLDEEAPHTFTQAQRHAYATQWMEAASEEVRALIKNNTWSLVDQPPDGRKALDGRWVFTVKRDAQGNIARFKARWVVKGFMQQYGVDFEQTFASVVKPMAFRVLFAIAAFLDLEIEQMDVKTAFLNGDIDAEVYVRYPEGFGETRICKLNKALYGLKQSPRLWYERLSRFLLVKLGLKHLEADHSIFVTPQGFKGPIITTWVDDIKIIAPDMYIVNRVKEELTAAFEMVDLGPISFYLGMTIARDRKLRQLQLLQKAYIKRVAIKFGMSDAKPTNTPMDESFDPIPNAKQATEKEIKDYQGIVGSVMFAMIGTRPDIANAVSIVSRFAQNPGQDHIKAARRIVAYLNTTCERGIVYGAAKDASTELRGYCDANWGGDRSTRKSTGSYLFMLNGGPVSWMSKLQPTVATSTCVAEYMAISFATKEATWLRLLLFGIMQEHPPQYARLLINTDSQSAKALAENPVHHDRTKHVDIVYHYIRDEIKSGRIRLEYIATDTMPADGLTKPLASIKFHRFIQMLGMRSNA